MKPWYEQSFGQDYMNIYKHRDWEAAAREVRVMAQWLDLPKGSSVLDIGCGMGRHALALSEAGYEVTGVDLSNVLLKEALSHDGEGRVCWKQGDMRALPFAEGSFEATVNLFTSFGYFTLEEDNQLVLREIRRVLKEGGTFLIDFLNAEYVARNLVARSERIDEESGLNIVEERSISAGWVQKEITVSDCEAPDQRRRYLERVRLYSLEWFQKHLKAERLELKCIYGNYDGSSYDREQSPRLIMAGMTI